MRYGRKQIELAGEGITTLTQMLVAAVREFRHRSSLNGQAVQSIRIRRSPPCLLDGLVVGRCHARLAALVGIHFLVGAALAAMLLI